VQLSSPVVDKYWTCVSQLSLQNGRRLAKAIGLPAQKWSIARCISELHSALLGVTGLASATGEPQVASESQTGLTRSQRYNLAILQLLQDGSFRDWVHPRFVAYRTSKKFRLNGHTLERLWLLALASRRIVCRRVFVATLATPRSQHTKVTKRNEIYRVKQWDEARKALAAAVESSVANRYEMQVSFANRPSPRAEAGLYEDISDPGESSSDDDVPLIEIGTGVSEKQYCDIDRAIRTLPGGRASPPELRRAVRCDMLNLLSSLRTIPFEVRLSEAIELLRDRGSNELGFETLLAVPSGSGVEPTVWPPRSVVARSMRRSEALYWLHESSLSLTYTPTPEEEVEHLFQIVETGGVQISKFTCRILVNIYDSVDGMAEDPAELADAFEVLGSEVQAQLLAELLTRQKFELLDKMSKPDEYTARILIYRYRTARRVLLATTDELRRAFGNDGRAGHEAGVAVHGDSGKLLVWLLPVLERAYAAAASTLRRFGSIGGAQKASLRAILQLEFPGATPMTRLQVYHAIHGAGNDSDAAAERRFEDTQRAWTALCGHVRGTDALDACARVMERFDGSFEAARGASVAQLAQCLAIEDMNTALEIQDALFNVV
jgi:hypothetical protein